MEIIKHYAAIGQVRYVKNNRAKNLSIRISRTGDVRVTVPRYMSMKKAESFLMVKRDWVLRKLDEQQARNETFRAFREGDLLDIRGNRIPLTTGNGESIEDAVWRILLQEAKHYLPHRTTELAGLHGFTISGVKIRRMKTRWGSCSTRNGINLNSWLMMLPDHLSDYVILHELVHTRYKDHSRQFWKMLDQLTGGQSKALRKELRNRPIMSIHTED